MKECSDFTSQDECEQEGCYWYDNSCHKEEEQCPDCEKIDEYVRCNYCGCYWYDSACHSEPKDKPLCEEITDPDLCFAQECYWYDSGCHTFPKEEPEPCKPCPAITNSSDCLRCGCFWWDSACHYTPPPVIICENILTEDACINQGCLWYDDSCHSEDETDMTIEEIDKELHDRLTLAAGESEVYLTDTIDNIIWTIMNTLTPTIQNVQASTDTIRLDLDNVTIWLDDKVKPLTETLTTEMLESITGMVDALGTPEALISFLLDVPEGEEEAMLTLMQLLVSRTLELGV